MARRSDHRFAITTLGAQSVALCITRSLAAELLRKFRERSSSSPKSNGRIIDFRLLLRRCLMLLCVRGFFQFRFALIETTTVQPALAQIFLPPGLLYRLL